MILSEARELLFDVVVPTIDSQESVDKFNRYLNLVQERYINSGKWAGMIREALIAAENGVFTLPPRFIAALAAKSICVNGSSRGVYPLQIINRWFSYRYPASYLLDQGNWITYGYAGAQDMGDGFVTFKESPYANYLLRITRASANDHDTKILLKGNDPSGNAIFTEEAVGLTSFEGMIVELTDSVTTPSQVFSGPLQFFQKLRTAGYIYLDAVNSTSLGAVTRIGYYAPSETAPSYHRYWIGCTNGSDKQQYVSALCKLRYTPAVADSDEVVPSNAGALRAGLAAMKCEAEGDLVRSQQFLDSGLKILSDEARESRGGARFGLKIDPTAFQFYRLWQGR